MICAEPERARLIEADWAGGMSATGISKRMGAAGWEVASGTILSHLKKHVPNSRNRTNAPIPTGLKRKDAAIFIRDRILNAIEEDEERYRMDLAEAQDLGDEDLVKTVERRRPNILDKNLQPALGTALKAESVIVKREDNQTKRKIDLFQLMLGGADGKGMLAPMHLIEDGTVIEGEAVEVGDDDDA